MSNGINKENIIKVLMIILRWARDNTPKYNYLSIIYLVVSVLSVASPLQIINCNSKLWE